MAGDRPPAIARAASDRAGFHALFGALDPGTRAFLRAVYYFLILVGGLSVLMGGPAVWFGFLVTAIFIGILWRIAVAVERATRRIH